MAGSTSRLSKNIRIYKTMFGFFRSKPPNRKSPNKPNSLQER